MDIKSSIQRVLKAEATAINNIPISNEFVAAVNHIHQCTGKVITTGIGKAGYVASRFAATLSSTGTPAFFVHPAEAGHGDLGMIAKPDVIIAFSTSGKSIEVLEMLANAAAIEVTNVIGITSHIDSPLRDMSKFTLDMGPDIEEPCPLNLTPSATIAAMSAISDAIALTLIELNGFTREDYGARHHKGYLGRAAREPHSYDNEGDN